MWINKSRITKSIIKVIFVAIIILLAGGINLPASQIRHVSAEAVHICLNRVNIPPEEMHWIYVPEFADQLYTEERY